MMMTTTMLMKTRRMHVMEQLPPFLYLVTERNRVVARRKEVEYFRTQIRVSTFKTIAVTVQGF